MDLTELFCDVDDFVKNFSQISPKEIDNEFKKYHRAFKLSKSEIIVICITFHHRAVPYKYF